MNQTLAQKTLYFIRTAEQTTAGPATRAGAPSRGGHLWLAFLAGLVLVACFETAVNTARWTATTQILAIFVMFLGAMPALAYLRRGNFKTIPFFEGHCLFYTLSFGYAGFRPPHGMPSLTSVSEYHIQCGLVAATLCLLMLYGGFYFLGARWFHNIRPFTMRIADSSRATARLLMCEAAIWAAFEAMRAAHVPFMRQVTETMRTFIFVHFIACQYLGILPRWARIFFWCGFVPWMLLVGSDLVDGKIYGLIMFAIWITMALLWARGRISLAWLAFAAFMVVLFQPVKVMYRYGIWEHAGEYTTMQKVDLFFQTLMRHGSKLHTGEEQKDAFEEAFSRVNHLLLTANVIRDTPDREPFQHGATYLPLLTKWIPRAVWPDKPVEDLGNRWGRQYHYLHYDDYRTSLNLPWLTEMFINFGWAGVVAIPLLIGLLFRWLWLKLAAAPACTVDFSLGVTLLSREILVESHLSMMLGNLLVGFLIIFTVLWLIRNTFPKTVC